MQRQVIIPLEEYNELLSLKRKEELELRPRQEALLLADFKIWLDQKSTVHLSPVFIEDFIKARHKTLRDSNNPGSTPAYHQTK
jgi:hypothetical protein